MTENQQYARIEELENALEQLVDCFDTSISQFADGDGGERRRAWIEVEVDMPQDNPQHTTAIEIVEGQVNQTTQDAIEHATKVLYDEPLQYDAEDE